MNDRHPSGTAHYAAFDGHSTTSFGTDPLFGDFPGDTPYNAASYDTGSHESGFYHTGQWPTSSYDTSAYAHGTSSYDTASYDTGGYDTGSFEAGGFETGSYDTTAIWAVSEQQHTGQWQAQPYDTQVYGGQPDATQTFEAPFFGATAYDTGAYDATVWNSAESTGLTDTDTDTDTGAHAYVPDQYSPAEYPAAHDDQHDDEPDLEPAPEPGPEPEPGPTPRAANRSATRSRRRTPAKRSALLTIAVPSVCVVGVAGIAAASVGGGGDEGGQAQAASAPDAKPVQPAVANNQLDTQLKDLSADAGDFADRASRTQERIDLKAKQEQDRRNAAEEAARKEAARPKFALPVKRQGLSAYFGQAGINWMSVHTGIDFPVWYGTPVMAATDGTVRTQINSAYGNMAIVTAKDGTETWYCHLSSYTVTNGPVKAGDVIAHSGKSGNSTGPHLHFEVRPNGGAAIDPLPWLRSHGLDPT
ncbi:peptidoglycan DD-metalloendopeptidase family protein [Streptomyces sp. NPDC016845]|uniref:peptidoglycan DD-metalloendopeptidase family protein n=1 Tax=Streptomyces sp. NPDC016845 TaxID=3364972 RepID=UPI0037AEF3CC